MMRQQFWLGFSRLNKPFCQDVSDAPMIRLPRTSQE
jgi:hypothetical protein